MGKTDNRIKVSIPPQLKEQLQAIADQLGVDLAPMIAQAAIEKYLGHKGVSKGSQEHSSKEASTMELIESRLSRLECRVDSLDGASKGTNREDLKEDCEGSPVDESGRSLRGTTIGDSIANVEGSIEEMPLVPVDELGNPLPLPKISVEEFQAQYNISTHKHKQLLKDHDYKHGAWESPDGKYWYPYDEMGEKQAWYLLPKGFKTWKQYQAAKRLVVDELEASSGSVIIPSTESLKPPQASQSKVETTSGSFPTNLEQLDTPVKILDPLEAPKSPPSGVSDLGNDQLKRDDFKAMWGLDNATYGQAFAKGSYTARDGSNWKVAGKKDKAVWSKQL